MAKKSGHISDLVSCSNKESQFVSSMAEAGKNNTLNVEDSTGHENMLVESSGPPACNKNYHTATDVGYVEANENQTGIIDKPKNDAGTGSANSEGTTEPKELGSDVAISGLANNPNENSMGGDNLVLQDGTGSVLDNKEVSSTYTGNISKRMKLQWKSYKQRRMLSVQDWML